MFPTKKTPVLGGFTDEFHKIFKEKILSTQEKFFQKTEKETFTSLRQHEPVAEIPVATHDEP
jgi:hypothetical protein